jgi:processive 1,2-diacylglycerol beta-glucosyltransferase
MSRPKRVLLLSLKAGAGHIRAAEAVREGIEERGGACEVRHIECLQFMTAFFRAGFNGFYGTMLHYTPSLWRMIYERTERQETDGAMKSAWGRLNRLHAGRLLREIRAFDANHIVCTHFIPAGLLAAQRRRGELRAKLSVVITDYDLHAAWLHRGVDHFCVASDEMARTLRAGGAHAASVDATGIPIVSAFRQPFPDKREMRERLKLDPARPAVLLSGGGCGLGRLDQMAALLSKEFPDAQFLTVAGNNKTLLAALQALAIGSKNILPMGFVSNMHEIMAACDVSVTKPGGLTSSECLAMGLPMILVDPIPGQEERNATFLLENGAACLANHPAKVPHKLRSLFDNMDRLQQMSHRAKTISKPHAAIEVCNIVMGEQCALNVPAPVWSAEFSRSAIECGQL